MIKYKYGALILAGGRGKRMGGIQKAFLTYGTATFLSMLEKTLSFLSPGYLSTNRPELAERTSLEPVADVIPNCGPMGGIYSVLCKCSCDALLVVPCDMPFFSVELAKFLLDNHQGEPVLYLKDEMGREYPLCGIYTGQCLPILEKLLKDGDFRMRQVAKQAGGRILNVPEGRFPSQSFLNVNTSQVYERICKEFGEEILPPEKSKEKTNQGGVSDA